jgi:hypothetical protein
MNFANEVLGSDKCLEGIQDQIFPPQKKLKS